MNITFKPFTKNELPLWQRWITVPHVKEVWFIEGYEPSDYMYQKIEGNGYDCPFVIYIDNNPVGYIQCCNLYAYRTMCPEPQGLFTHEEPGTYCLDLFIAESDYLDKGYGTAIVKLFTQKLIDEFNAKKVLIDPASSNKRAIRCYEKAGYSFVKTANDGITDCTIMQFLPSSDLPYSPACERNKQPIVEKLQQYLKPGDKVLEIGSGTGQHARYFAQHMPDVIWQPSDQGDYFELLQKSLSHSTYSNLLAAMSLDVTSYDWAQQQYNAVFSANTLHIMSQSAGEQFISNVSKAITDGGHLIVYGPFMYDGQFTSESNARFDKQLQLANAEQGIREFDHINELLTAQGFSLVADHAMPANNQLLVWQLAH
ncbi:MAG: GNAT family N-acetyltransferase [Coxiellaceae bacterium]|nr:GNAT family N-acetyltransferase [Coxiellaceae bacterium]